MAEPLLTDIFGSGATQNASTITIQKADLTGLTPSATNSAESLLAAIVLKAAGYLTTTNQDVNPDQSITISQGIGSIQTDGNQNYRIYPYTIDFRKVDNQVSIDPDDF